MNRVTRRAVESKNHRETLTVQDKCKRRNQRNVLGDSTNVRSSPNLPVEKETKTPNVDSPNASGSNGPCLYSKVNRKSLTNRDMMVEEKLALYEFELDENEPTGGKTKGKLKRQLKGKKKNTSDEDFLPPKLRKKPMGLNANGAVSMQTRARDAQRKRLPLSERAVSPQRKRKISEPIYGEDVSVSGASHTKRAQKGANTSTVTERRLTVSLRRVKDEQIQTPVVEQRKGTSTVDADSTGNVDLVSPVARPRRTRRNARRSLESQLHEISAGHELEPADEGGCVSESENKDYVVTPDVHQEISARESEASRKDEIQNMDISMNVVSLQSKAPTPQENVPSQVTPRSQDISSIRFSVNRRTYLDSSRASCSPATVKPGCALPRLSRVYFAPRLSVGMESVNKPGLRDWDVDNCFGFDDNAEVECLSPVPCTSVPQPVKSAFPMCSTPEYQVSSSKVLPTRMVPQVKSTASCSKSICQAVTVKSAVQARAQPPRNILPEKPLSAFSSPPLKQAELNFNRESLHQSPVSQLNTGENAATPVLFQDEDKTPVYFSEPSRRSYERPVRRKRTPRHDEQFVYEDEDEDEEIKEKKNKSQKPKRDGRNKKEEIMARKWMKNFNSQCGEIEEFELCVE